MYAVKETKAVNKITLLRVLEVDRAVVDGHWEGVKRLN